MWPTKTGHRTRCCKDGVVVNVGAPLSHAIIVSRELGIPCVVSANDATERIPNGALVEVNGDTGVVTCSNCLR